MSNANNIPPPADHSINPLTQVTYAAHIKRWSPLPPGELSIYALSAELPLSPTTTPSGQTQKSSEFHEVAVIFHTVLSGIHRCAKFMDSVLYGDDYYYKTQRLAGGGSRRIVSDIGKNYKKIHSFKSIFSRDYVYHPAIEFFFEEYRSSGVQVIADMQPNFWLDDQTQAFEKFDGFIASMREHAVQTGLKKKISDWESKLAKNKARLQKLETQIFKDHARVTVIRLDLEYKSVIFSDEEIRNIRSLNRFEESRDYNYYYSGGDLSEQRKHYVKVSFEQLQADRQRFFANMKGKPSLFKHLVGYVWRIEFTPRAGYHLHVCLFFNGSQVQKHAWLGDEIGNYWFETITKGLGRFHNCNRDWKSDDPNCGVGVINHDDFARRENLRKKVLPYLCKDTQLVQVLPYQGCNLFGTSLFHRDRAKGRGRPRTKGLEKADQPVREPL